MAAFNFPNSPSTNDLHTENGVTFKWNGTIWLRVGNSYSDISTLNVSGIGTFGGHLYISEYLIHSGDTNTWFRFPSNDNITLGTSGAERVRIDANGFVAIGHDSPSSFSSGANNLVVRDASGAGGITIVTPNNAEGAIFFADGTGGSGQGRVRYNHSDDSMHFSTNATERLRIDSSGNIGAGTNSPSSFSASDFVISKSANAGMTISVGNAGTTNTASIFFAEGTGGTGDKERGAIKYKHGDDYLAFHTDYDERLRIDSSGDVLIGHTSSTTVTGEGLPLQVQGSGGYTGASLIRTSAAGAQLQFAAGSSGNNVANNTGLGYIKFFGYHTNGYDESARIHAEIDGTPGDGDAPGAIVFSTTSDGSSSVTERLRIRRGTYSDQYGCLMIGGTNEGHAHSDSRTLILGKTAASEIGITLITSTSGSGKIRFSDGVSPYNRGTIEYNHSNDSLNFVSAGGNPGYALQSNQRSFFNVVNSYVAIDKNNTGVIMEFIKSGNQVGNIGINNSSTTYNTSSDYRLKENIVDLTGAITRLKQLKPRRFNFKVDDSITVDGFIAHEVTSVPEAITGTKDQVATSDDVASGISTAVGDPVYQGIDQSKIVPLLTAALQEAISKIETLETKVATLESS